MNKYPPSHKSLEFLFDRLSETIAAIVAHPETHWGVRNPLMDLTNDLTNHYASEPLDWAVAIKFSMPRALRKAQTQTEGGEDA